MLAESMDTDTGYPSYREKWWEVKYIRTPDK